MQNKWYWAFKNIFFGPFLRIYNRPTMTGAENIPAEGSAVLASSHQSVMDSFFFPLLADRQITFLAKKEYFEGVGFVGKMQKWFFTSVGQVPIDRDAADSVEGAMSSAEQVFARGDLLGVYPEGTRSPDGRIYKGKTGAARIALACNQPIIPVAMKGSREANPIGSWIIRPAKVEVIVGKPIPSRKYVESLGLDYTTHAAARALTDHVTAQFVAMTGYEYVDDYASKYRALSAKKK